MQQANARSALVIEDHAASREALRRLLRALGHDTDAVSTVAEAEQRIRSARYVFLDLHLTDGNGIDLLRRIRGDGIPVKVAVMTGSASDSMLAEVRKLQPDALFIKPVDFGKVVEWLTGA